MKNEHIVLKIIIIMVCLAYIGANLYFDIPQRVSEYFHNSLNTRSVDLDLDETYTLKLKNKENYTVSSNDPSVVKISSEMKLTPVKAGNTSVTVKTKRQTLECAVTVENKSLNPRTIYLTPKSSYQMSRPSGNVSYSSAGDAITVKNGLIQALKEGEATIVTKSKSETFENKVIVQDIMKHMYSTSVTVYDATKNKMLYTKNSYTRMNPASITKILSVYTFLQKIDNVNDKATLTQSDISTAAASGAVVTGMSAGENITYNDLLHGALLVSGADAIKAMERSLYGSTAALAATMNTNAQRFGMTSSHFTNGVGMTDANLFTTGSDLVKLLDHVLKDKRFKKLFYTKTYKTSDGLHTFHSPSKSYGSQVLGAKNGLTNAAAECVALDEKVNGHHIYIITMHALTASERKWDIVKINQYLPFILAEQ